MGRVAREEKTPKHDFSFLSQLIKESSEATRTISEAFADGKVTPEEALDCIKELKDLISIAVQLIQASEAIEAGGKDYKLK